MKTQYDKISSAYHKHMAEYKSVNKNDFVKQLNLDTKPIAVFEYGCGTGIDASYLLSNYKTITEYVGIDNSESMIKKFKKNVVDKRALVELADLDDYTPATNKFDLIFGLYAVHYTNDLKLLMRKAYEALKPDGYFAFRDAHPLVGLFRKKSKKYDVKENVDFIIAGGGDITLNHPTFTFEEYVESSVEAGFKIIKLTENMGSQSKAHGIAGFEIPTTFTMILQK